MTFDDVDTITPLDGEDGNVAGVAEQFPNVPEDGYSTKGQTTVATRRGYRFVPSNKDLPVITSAGLKMTKDEAEAVVAESSGRVSIVNDNTEED